MKRGKSSKLHKRITYNFLLIAIFSILILMALALLVQTGAMQNPWVELNKNIEMINSTDACSIIAGKLIHTIEDEGSCENICHSECETRQKVFQNSEFVQNTDSCNNCNCYCK